MIKKLLIFVYLLLTLCILYLSLSVREEYREVVIKDKRLIVKVAKTPLERAKGLMFVRNLKDDEGMLFIFPKEDTLRFWAKNTYIDLSVAYIGKDSVIFEICDLKALDTTIVKSSREGMFALEVNKRWFEKNGVGIGDTVRIGRVVKKKVELEL